MTTHTHNFYACVDGSADTLLYSFSGDSLADASGETHVTGGEYACPTIDYKTLFTEYIEDAPCEIYHEIVKSSDDCEDKVTGSCISNPCIVACNGLPVTCDGECVYCL